MSILEMSISGGIMAVAVTVIRALFLNKMPKKTFVFLWEITMLRLLLPLSVPSVTSIYTLFANIKNSVRGNTVNIPPAAETAANYAFLSADGLMTGTADAAACVSVWETARLAGTVIFFLLFLAGYIIVYRKYRFPEFIGSGYAAEWLSERKLLRKVRIGVSGETSSPFTYGIIRPLIILPENIKNERSEQLGFILEHELTHIRRFDMLRKMAAAAVLCLHWFDPAVWVLFLLYNRDIELACDEAVVRKTGGDPRRAYAMALIDMEEKKLVRPSLFTYFSKNAVEERIEAVMKTKKLTFAASVSACFAVMAVTCVFATSAAADNLPGEIYETVTAVASPVSDDISREAAGSPDDGSYNIGYLNGWTYVPAEVLNAKYGAFGLYFGSDGKVTFEGKTVRYFADQAKSKRSRDDPLYTPYDILYACYSEDGDIDVYAGYDDPEKFITVREATADEYAGMDWLVSDDVRMWQEKEIP